MRESAGRFLGFTPLLHYDDAVAMIDWLVRVFGFVEKGRWLDEQGKIRTAELYVGSGELWLDGDPEWWKRKGHRPDEWLGVWVDDVDALFERIQAAGVSAAAPEDKYYAVRVLEVRDPEGYIWGFLQRARYFARTPAEIAQEGVARGAAGSQSISVPEPA